MADFAIGLISCGNMGMGLAGQAATIEGARVACCCDVDEQKARAAADQFGCDWCLSTDDLLAREDINAVMVAAPNFLHSQITVAAAHAGKHVFCEKPMALCKADCLTMIDACEQAGVKLMIGQVLRYSAPYVWIIEMVRAGELGEPFGIQVSRIGGGWTGGTYDADWRRHKETCGGPLYEINQHEIDFMRCIMGDVASVVAMMDNFISKDEFDYDDFAYVMMGFESGGTGCLLGGHSAFLGRYDGKLYCSKGSLYFNSTCGEVEYKVQGKDALKVPYGEVTGYEKGLHREVREWVEACVNDTEPPIPGSEGMKNVEIAEAAEISVETRIIVDLPL